MKMICDCGHTITWTGPKPASWLEEHEPHMSSWINDEEDDNFGQLRSKNTHSLEEAWVANRGEPTSSS